MAISPNTNTTYFGPDQLSQQSVPAIYGGKSNDKYTGGGSIIANEGGKRTIYLGGRDADDPALPKLPDLPLSPQTGDSVKNPDILENRNRGLSDQFNNVQLSNIIMLAAIILIIKLK